MTMDAGIRGLYFCMANIVISIRFRDATSSSSYCGLQGDGAIHPQNDVSHYHVI